MPTYTIKKYEEKDHSLWNDFIDNTKNGTFLFYRDFMEYHSDRFHDFSLLIFDKSKLIAVFPANIKDRNIYSHQGLTYGGLILEQSIGGKKVKDILSEIVRFLRAQKFCNLFIKPTPVFYHQKPTNEFTFFLSEYGAKLYGRDLNLAIDYSLPSSIHKSKLKHYEKRKHLGFEIQEVNDFSGFWEKVLIPRLKEKHNVKPVHTLEEIHLLKNRFPEFIHQFVISLNDEILAGITIFKNAGVVKSQYGAVTNSGEQYRALDFLFIFLIDRYRKEGFRFFDMGTVTDDNFGLLKQKEELGCEIYMQDFYELVL
ncbi:Acetyltransferase (GNAT) domain-containing protein [Aquimarina amphilecti]|uniref:Acetyltransferase (GNAT) domain-containing protein n=1 Tax=Aquimarina amphilecti TaxID=1038014 RepID=A0A1H7WBN9_AQUAM|nr:GNAT family N-acetyltransferase [Aquimarina amphilecti]SEM18923.1 Acetyltransferase (GNAT) domain-containing protein [Aquimarina amphilecti]